MKNSNSHFSKYAIGVVIGLVAGPVLKSGVAKKAYTYLTAGGFIAKNGIMEAAENLQASAQDISEDAKVITERYYQKQDAKFAEEEQAKESAANSAEEEA